MKAIVSVMQTSHGENVQILGHGPTEQAARVAAYAAVHHGHNIYEEEYRRGTLVTVSRPLADLIRQADRWDDVFNEEGQLVASSASEAHMRMLTAYGVLYVVGDELRAHSISPLPQPCEPDSATALVAI